MIMQLEPLQHEVSGEHVVRRCNIKRFNDNGSWNETVLWFEFDKSVPVPPENDCDAYVLSVLMDAMKENRSIKVNGSVSKELLSNLIEFQAAWHKWREGVYSLIDITVDLIREVDKRTSGAICAFSGGVDATFSVWMHSQLKRSYRSQIINLCSMVHGFDIPLSSQSDFENAKNNAQNTLNDVDIKLIPISTNFREISNVSWDDSHSLALVAALSNFKNLAGTCIVGSSKPYDSLVIPYGSTPITDHLLSSGDFFVMHDGASHSRTEKVKEISEWVMGIKHLRVCWQAGFNDRNCGVCEKCVRTKLNFLATGSAIPPCFSDSNILNDMQKVKLGSDAVRVEWIQIYDYAVKNKKEGPWIQKVKKIINKKPFPWIDFLFPQGSPRRKIAKKWTEKINLE